MYAIWFVFEKNDNEYFSNIIKELSIKYNSQIFVPHITAYGLVDVDLNTLNNVVMNSIKDEKSFFVEKNQISFSNNFWKTIFIEFLQNTQLKRINKRLTEHLNLFSKYQFKPHLSLIYKKMNQNEQKEITNSIKIKEKFKISEVWIQQFSEDIAKWRIVSKYQLDNI